MTKRRSGPASRRPAVSFTAPASTAAAKHPVGTTRVASAPARPATGAGPRAGARAA
eukprot:CAMPEP_0119089738 /NCGR_PEP_ID=MMETSP1178-20130426/149974_1 /TAXON_ID=33656 /ORGANISM="unid sp, Strain CCMP2000" /LENGTH=55 /DNA_ID=CAMNT_0007073111 /DNA_START=37 /DNA_END=201 /DNA_ORIENTATION=-